MATNYTEQPDWRHAHHKLTELFANAMLGERAAGTAKVLLTDEKILQFARWKATRAIEEAIRQYESPEAVRARKRKLGAAA